LSNTFHQYIGFINLGGSSEKFALFGKQGQLASITNFDWIHMGSDDGKDFLSSLVAKNLEVEPQEILSITKVYKKVQKLKSKILMFN